MTFKRTMCALLAASLLATGAIATQSVVSAATVDVEDSAAVVTEEASYGLASNIQDGVILHCFDWKYNDIKAELPNIAAAGFTAVQTSPAQPDGTGYWYWLYQPKGFYIGNNGLGTKADLEALCAEADKYGVKVVVDVVANHLAGEHIYIQEDLRDSQYWHTWGSVPNDKWTDRDWVRFGDIGMQDLATENSYVQQTVLKYVNELKAAGVDGIRWDAAKHISLPSEGDNFWSVVTNNTGLYNYGEILVGPDDRSSGNEGLMKEYTNYISVTDSQYCGDVRNAFASGNVYGGYGNWTARGITSDKIVYWGESHDTWANAYEGDYSWNKSQNVIDRAYASVASRNQASALYFSRPLSNPESKENTFIGEKGSTHFTSKEVAEVNKFHNAMIGKEDYYTSSNGCAVITRKGGGAVIVKGSGSGQVSVANGGGYAKPGTYTDAVSGNTFTITADSISGTIGDSGIAVIYDASGSNDTDIKQTDTDKKTTDVDPNASVNIYFDNSAYNWSNVYAYVYDESTGTAKEKAAWPGVQMTKDSATGYYVVNVDDFKNGQVIFSDGTGSADKRYPADMQPGMQIGGSSKLFAAGNNWSNYTAPSNTDSDKKESDTDKKDSDSDKKDSDTKTKVLSGDVNDDGKVTLRDASLTLKAVVGSVTLDNKAKLAADVDDNDKVTAADSLAIQRYDIGIASNSIGKTVEK